MSILLDPANADNFRMTVDWGRWYIDPLPADNIAEATEDRWPSISAVKKASEKDWSFLSVQRIAALPTAELQRIATLGNAQRLDALRSHEKHAKSISFGRGTITHLWAEDLLAGQTPRQITDQWLTANGYPAEAVTEAELYLPALVDFFDVYQPEPVAVEYVTIHRTLNGHGYGGTPDALVRIEGEVVAIDWKTRNGDKPAAYPEELAQIAAGARAEYMVVGKGGDAARQAIPAVAGGYVVSIHTNGARLYPLDLDKGWEHWCKLHEWWVAKLTEKAGIKRVLPFRTSGKADAADAAREAVNRREARVLDGEARHARQTPPTTPDHRTQLLERYGLLNADDQAKYVDAISDRGIDKTDLDAIEALLDEIEPFHNTTARPTLTEGGAPDEGETVADGQPFDALAERFGELDAAGKATFQRIETEARQRGRTFLASKTHGKRTQRRHHIYDGLLSLIEHDQVEDELLRQLVATAMDSDAPHFPVFTHGEIVGALNATEAAKFAHLCWQLNQPITPDAPLNLRPLPEAQPTAEAA